MPPLQPLVSLFDDFHMVTALARTISGGNYPSIAMKAPHCREPVDIGYLCGYQNREKLSKPRNNTDQLS